MHFENTVVESSLFRNRKSLFGVILLRQRISICKESILPFLPMANVCSNKESHAFSLHEFVHAEGAWVRKRKPVKDDSAMRFIFCILFIDRVLGLVFHAEFKSRMSLSSFAVSHAMQFYCPFAFNNHLVLFVEFISQIVAC